MRKNIRASAFLACCAALFALARPLAAQSLQVHTESGDLSGAQSKLSSVLSFKGIPFAAPPVGELRWKPPAPAQPWKGVRNAIDFGAACMQRVHGDFLPWTAEYLTHNKVSEDCLFLNVWTPKLSAAAKLPVMVYIHGGGFSEGSGDVPIYDGENLAKTGLVIVTVNYRLGVFGFLAHPELTAESDRHSSGNYALLDQIAALRWVKANIAAFGGDPNRVTIWGQSAGAFSVAALIASPVASGLFQQAIADSGIGIAGLPMSNLKSAEEAGSKFAEAHHAASLKDLRAVPAQDLLPGPHDNPLGFTPIVDGWVLPDTPLALSSRGADNDVPVITGYQANDGMLFVPPVPTVEAFDQLAKRQYGEVADEFKRLYPVKTADEAKTVLYQSIRDRDRVSQYLWASRRAKSHRQPVFTYFFDRAVPWPQHPEFGAFHSGELPYFFSNLKTLDRPWEQIDYDIAKTSTAFLKNFASTGNPNGANLPKWPAVDAHTPATMEIGSRIDTMPLADRERLDFWMRFFDSPAGAHAPPF
jgi:para-nitrobenzyl esterase